MYAHYKEPTTNGQIVKFIRIEGVELDPELQSFFVVTEMKGDRVLITAINTGMTFPPSQTVKTSDLYVYPQFQKNKFSIDAYGAVEFTGYHIPTDLWNGWENPVFEKSEAIKVVADQNKLNIDYPEQNDILDWDGENIVHTAPVCDPDEEPHKEVIEPMVIYVNGELKTVYPICNYYWCWSLSDNATELAKELCVVLNKWLSVKELKKIRKGKNDPDDFCDANMAMDEAFVKVMGRHPIMPSEVEKNPELDAQESDDVDLWNAAYEIAHKAKYTIAS